MANAAERRQKQLQRLRDKQRERERELQASQSSSREVEARRRQNEAPQQQDQVQRGQSSRPPRPVQSYQHQQTRAQLQAKEVAHVLEQCRKYLALMHDEWVPLGMATEEEAEECRRTTLSSKAAWLEIMRRFEMIYRLADREYSHWAGQNPRMRRGRQIMMELWTWVERLPQTRTPPYPSDQEKDSHRLQHFREIFSAWSLASESPPIQESEQVRTGTRDDPIGTSESGRTAREPDEPAYGESRRMTQRHTDSAARQGPEQPHPRTPEIHYRTQSSRTTQTASMIPTFVRAPAGVQDDANGAARYRALRREFVELGLLAPEDTTPATPSTRSAWQSELDDLETRLVNRQRSHVEDPTPQEASGDWGGMVRRLARLHGWITKARRLHAGTTVPGANFRPVGF